MINLNRTNATTCNKNINFCGKAQTAKKVRQCLTRTVFREGLKASPFVIATTAGLPGSVFVGYPAFKLGMDFIEKLICKKTSALNLPTVVTNLGKAKTKFVGTNVGQKFTNFVKKWI